MRRPDLIARQSACPSGLLGRLISSIMSVETDMENSVALDLLDLKPTDYVVEVGFGHGKTIQRAAATSDLMVRVASRRNRHFIRAGRVELKLADAATIPYPSHHFDKAYSVHTIYFWPNPKDQIGEIRRVLKPRGCFVLCFRYDTRALNTFPAGVYKFYTGDQVSSLLEESGFENVRLEMRQHSSRVLFWAVAHKPE
jgi:ubiquinone/menaquinone biosynthesis C-methylase UbiE